MSSFFQNTWDRVRDVPTQTGEWFNHLNREEWLVVLIVICAIGFMSLLGFQSRRL
jgi:hypothetical protein